MTHRFPRSDFQLDQVQDAHLAGQICVSLPYPWQGDRGITYEQEVSIKATLHGRSGFQLLVLPARNSA